MHIFVKFLNQLKLVTFFPNHHTPPLSDDATEGDPARLCHDVWREKKTNVSNGDILQWTIVSCFDSQNHNNIHHTCTQ